MTEPESALARLLDQLDPAAARAALLRCCGSGRFADRMVAARPFENDAAVLSTAERVADTLDAGDWLEAFAAHPRLGGGPGRGPSEPDDSAKMGTWSKDEQAGARDASLADRAALAEANAAYEARFGHVFLLCATGLDARAMLAALNQRLGTTPAEELALAALEQRKITRLRLGKLAGSMADGGPATS